MSPFYGEKSCKKTRDTLSLQQDQGKPSLYQQRMVRRRKGRRGTCRDLNKTVLARESRGSKVTEEKKVQRGLRGNEDSNLKAEGLRKNGREALTLHWGNARSESERLLREGRGKNQ